MKNKLLRDILHDLAVVCLTGAALDVVLFGVLFIVLWIATGQSVSAALGYVRSVLMFVGALALLICAGLLLFRKGTNLRDNERWRNRFHRFGLFPVVLGVALFLLALAVILDYLLFVPPVPVSSIIAGEI